jgi:hypothetical protein
MDRGAGSQQSAWKAVEFAIGIELPTANAAAGA